MQPAGSVGGLFVFRHREEHTILEACSSRTQTFGGGEPTQRPRGV